MPGDLRPVDALYMLQNTTVEHSEPAHLPRRRDPGRVVLEGIRWGHVRDHRGQMRGMVKGRHPLIVGDVGSAPGNHLAIGPRLRRDPLDTVIAVLAFVPPRHKSAVRVTSAANIHPDEVVAVLSVELSSLLLNRRVLVVRGTRKQGGVPPGSRRAVHVGRHFNSVPQRRALVPRDISAHLTLHASLPCSLCSYFGLRHELISTWLSTAICVRETELPISLATYFVTVGAVITM